MSIVIVRFILQLFYWVKCIHQFVNYYIAKDGISCGCGGGKCNFTSYKEIISHGRNFFRIKLSLISHFTNAHQQAHLWANPCLHICNQQQKHHWIILHPYTCYYGQDQLSLDPQLFLCLKKTCFWLKRVSQWINGQAKKFGNLQLLVQVTKIFKMAF